MSGESSSVKLIPITNSAEQPFFCDMLTTCINFPDHAKHSDNKLVHVLGWCVKVKICCWWAESDGLLTCLGGTFSWTSKTTWLPPECSKLQTQHWKAILHKLELLASCFQVWLATFFYVVMEITLYVGAVGIFLTDQGSWKLSFAMHWHNWTEKFTTVTVSSPAALSLAYKSSQTLQVCSQCDGASPTSARCAAPFSSLFLCSRMSPALVPLSGWITGALAKQQKCRVRLCIVTGNPHLSISLHVWIAWSQSRLCVQIHWW